MTLHSVGPTTLGEDEHTIGRGYQRWLVLPLGAGPMVAAHYLEIKWVVAIGFAVALPLLHEIGGRLYDLCIRLRRTNILFSQRNSKSDTTEMR